MLDRSGSGSHPLRMAQPKVIFYPVDLACPACGSVGDADARETIGELHESYTIEVLTGAFVAVRSGVRPGKAVIRCQCGEEFRA